MKTTYIYQKDSTLWAFEGPEEPKKYQKGDSLTYNEAAWMVYKERMSTALESSLPVVNYIDVAILIGDKCYSRTLSPQIEFKNEPVALPGWGLENEKQVRYIHRDDEETWSEDNEYCPKDLPRRQAYRLVRSEPEKPDNSAHGSPKYYCGDCNVSIGGISSGCNYPECGGEPEPSESQKETQEAMLYEILENYDDWRMDGDGDDQYNESLKQFMKAELGKFTITRK